MAFAIGCADCSSIAIRYFINSDFQRNTAYAPSHISDEDREEPYVREISINEIFPDKDIPNGQPLRLRTFDLAFYPEERGPYNFDVEGGDYSNGISEDGKLLAPETRWGGFVRKLDNNDFQRALILPALSGVGQPATLLTNPLSFSINSKVRIMDHGLEYDARLVKEFASSTNFKQFQYEKIDDDKGSRRKKQPEIDSSFNNIELDEIWDLI